MGWEDGYALPAPPERSALLGDPQAYATFAALPPISRQEQVKATVAATVAATVEELVEVLGEGGGGRDGRGRRVRHG